MGLMPSSDLFNINSDKAIDGLNSTLKSVDDFITTAKDWKELKARMTVLFRRFRDLNIKVKPSKLRLWTRVKFGDFECKAKEGEVRIMPDPSRLRAIADIQPPRNKSEIRAFLGMTLLKEPQETDH